MIAAMEELDGEKRLGGGSITVICHYARRGDGYLSLHRITEPKPLQDPSVCLGVSAEKKN
jgi:hypothetical protein